ncbi:MAG: hypothetical protein GXO30_00160 [Epsilonproteobacteria bacterium]|nr:hypothetical protein [Campylobacterota bacterium]
MDINSVPQDESATYAKMKKAIYASDDDGKLKTIGSSGWDVEEIATNEAIEDINNNIKEAYKEVKDGKKSPLYYHMFEARMDLVVLSQSTGFFKWSIKRHFKPEIFSKLDDKKLLEYCDVLGKTLAEIKTLPEKIDE